MEQRTFVCVIICIEKSVSLKNLHVHVVVGSRRLRLAGRRLRARPRVRVERTLVNERAHFALETSL